MNNTAEVLSFPNNPDFGDGDGDEPDQYGCPYCFSDAFLAYADGYMCCADCGEAMNLRAEWVEVEEED